MNKPFGLGDLAYYLFRPAVYATDFIWGTDMRHCQVCAARRKRWNAIASAPAWKVLLVVTIGAVLIFWLAR